MSIDAHTLMLSVVVWCALFVAYKTHEFVEHQRKMEGLVAMGGRIAAVLVGSTFIPVLANMFHSPPPPREYEHDDRSDNIHVQNAMYRQLFEMLVNQATHNQDRTPTSPDDTPGGDR
jgi:hypothetical protein